MSIRFSASPSGHAPSGITVELLLEILMIKFYNASLIKRISLHRKKDCFSALLCTVFRENPDELYICDRLN